MPTWGEILQELGQLQQTGKLPPGASPFDVVRRKYLRLLSRRTKRNVILYASKWTQPGAAPDLISITPEDVQGLMEVVHGLQGDSLDLILHSPGGAPEATEALVLYLRTKFNDIRVFIPHAAMSAATMLACSANRIVMGKHSFLGPIDPQLIIETELGRASVPVYAILEQFALAQKECGDPSLFPSWVPMLRQYGPALIVQCKLAQELSRSLVSAWLTQYMFANVPDGQAKAANVARALADHATFKSHGRFIARDQAKALGLIIDDLESDQRLQDTVLAVFHAVAHTFNGTPAVKLVENHLGKAFIKQQVVAVQQRVGGPPGQVAPPPSL